MRVPIKRSGMFKLYREKRPWGEFHRFAHNTQTTVKIITVKPGEALSYQFHRYRDELWVALTVGLQITLDDRDFIAVPYEHILIPRLTKHRATGVGEEPAKWLEVSFGEFDEGDEVRLEDRYGRS